MSKKYRVTILGDGGWGTALAVVNARHGNDVVLWSGFPDYAEILEKKRENIKFLPGIKLSHQIKITSDIKEAARFGELIVLAIPTQYLRNVLFALKSIPHIGGRAFVSVAKGIETKTCLRPSEIIQSQLGKTVPLVVLSGPSHAEEVARDIPTLVVAASKNQKAAEFVQAVLKDTYFRVYIQQDLVGVELGGALKNIIAIAAGICDGLGFGDNTKSGMLSRGLFEMTRLGIKFGANPNTFFGLSGMGDLVTTCFSKHGRNLYVGKELGKGRTLKSILNEMEMIAEGVDTAKAIHELCQRINISLPIMEEVFQILFAGKDARKAVTDLLARTPYEEWKAYKPFMDFNTRPAAKKKSS